MVGMAEVTWQDAKADLKLTVDTFDATVERLFYVAQLYVDNFIGVQDIFEPVYNEAILTGVRELWKRVQNPQGAAQQLNEVGAPLPFRLSKDPFVTVRELLKPYLVSGF